MNVQEAFQMLREKGFKVRDPAEVAKQPIDDKFIEMVRYQTIDNNGEFVESSSIEFRRGCWVLVRWSYVPGPGYDDFEAEFESLDQVVAALLTYYTGQPILINEWVLPAHKHPEWDLKRLPSVIAEAQPITSAEWKTVETMHSRLRWLIDPDRRTWELKDIFACLFISIPHGADPSQILQLRRDLEVAYIVRR